MTLGLDFDGKGPKDLGTAGFVGRCWHSFYRNSIRAFVAEELPVWAYSSAFYLLELR